MSNGNRCRLMPHAYRLLGRTGVRVSELSLGAMSFGSLAMRITTIAFGSHGCTGRRSQTASTRRHLLQGESEEIVGRALRGRRQSVVSLKQVLLANER